MRKINLLPWREELRREAQRNFIIVLVLAALLAAGCVFAVNRYFEAQLSNQDARNAFLKSEITKLDRKIARIDELDETRSRLLERKQVIEDLQANRTLMVRLFDQMVRTVPTGIRLLNARQVDDQITLRGTSQSNARVSTYLRNLEAASVLHEPRLRIIEAETEDTDSAMPYMFELAATVAPPETVDEDARQGAAEGEQ
jgi:type IV pilus assembly protein PilN